jgi:hypothetical protein
VHLAHHQLHVPARGVPRAFKAEAIEVTEPGSYQYFLALQQDYDQMQRQQTGLRNRLLTHLTLVHEELNVANFHMRVDKYVSGKA